MSAALDRASGLPPPRQVARAHEDGEIFRATSDPWRSGGRSPGWPPVTRAMGLSGMTLFSLRLRWAVPDLSPGRISLGEASAEPLFRIIYGTNVPAYQDEIGKKDQARKKQEDGSPRPRRGPDRPFARDAGGAISGHIAPVGRRGVRDLGGGRRPCGRSPTKAGVGVGTVYRHFPQRADLIAAVFRREIDACADAAPILAAEHTPFDALAGWMQRYAAFVGAKRGLANALHSGDPAYDALPAHFDQRLRPALRTLFESAAAAVVRSAPTSSRDDLFERGREPGACRPPVTTGPNTARRGTLRWWTGYAMARSPAHRADRAPGPIGMVDCAGRGDPPPGQTAPMRRVLQRVQSVGRLARVDRFLASRSKPPPERVDLPRCLSELENRFRTIFEPSIPRRPRLTAAASPGGSRAATRSHG